MGRRLGQHFLADRQVAQRIAESAGIGPDDQVFEVGGGRGALTEHLVGQGRRLVVAELDEALAASLEAKFGPALSLLRGDAAEVDLGELGHGQPWVVVGNLPYYHTSALLLWLAAQWRVVREAVVMIQAEVAERLAAEAGEAAYGRLTVALAYRSHCELLFRVEPDAFRPPPKVTSAVVRFTFRAQPAVAVQDEQLFFAVVEHGFRWRRKTLATVLRQWRGLPREQCEALLQAAGIDPQRRAETLDLTEFARLSDTLQEARR